MRCPVCQNSEIEMLELEPNLWARVCGACNGKWISNNNYQKWLECRGEILSEIPSDEPNISVREFELARLCPKCRRILVKYKVGRNIPFKIDRCGNCAGVWLDENEWETLKSRNLHDEINKIFTDHWQEKIKQEETREALRTIYEQKFGLEDYKKIRAFKTWINSHEKSGEILAYIRDKNPLQF